MNDGSDYEDLIQGVVAAISASLDVETLALETRQRIPGRTMVHEVDVWWRFRRKRQIRSVWITCKDWGRAVGNGAMWEFAGKLDDIEPRPHGVFVVRNRLQSGALKVAAAHGITAWEIRPPTEDDWDGRIRGTGLTLALSVPQREVHIRTIDSSVADVTTTVGIVSAVDVQVTDADGTSIGSLHDLMVGLTPQAEPGQETLWTSQTRTFDPPARLSVPGGGTQILTEVEVKSRWVVAHRKTRLADRTTIPLIIRDALGDGMSVVRHGPRARVDEVTTQLLSSD